MISTTLALTLAIVAVSPPASLAGPDLGPVPGSITPYDIATRDDLLFSYMLAPLIKGEVADWPLMGGLAQQVGDWVTPFVGAQQIANIITEAFSIEGQPALKPLEAEVERCARILGLPRPTVYVRNSPFTRAYVVRAFQQDHLIVTSGLLNLYEGRPDELSFVIGHELGHLKCGHQELKQKSYGLLSAIQAINLAVVPDKFQAVLPTLG